jgi:hypothetical protein
LVVLALVSGLACDAKDPDDDMIADDHDDAEDGDDDPDDDEDDEDDEPVTQSEDDDMPDEPPPPPPAPRPDAAVPCDPSAWGGNVCTTADGAEGVSYCIVVDGEQLDTPCTTEPGECEPGDNQDYGCMGSICVWNGADFEYFSWSEPDCITPLVVQLDGETSFQPATATPFDMSSDGTCTQTDWPTAPWLALDRDGDGVITSGAELFGSATKMSTGGYASNGFAALAELDDNRDGRIDAQDAAFAKLVLWSDLDDDRMGTTAELRRIGDAHLVAIDLAFDRRASCDGNGNCGLERAAFEYQTAEGTTTIGEIVDVHLQCR